MYNNYDDLFALQRELEKLREDETDDFTRIKQLIHHLAIDFGIHRDILTEFQSTRLHSTETVCQQNLKS